MDWKSSYNDICAELRVLHIYEMELRKRVELAHEVMFSGEIQSSGSYCHLPLDKSIDHYNKAVDDLAKAQAEVDRLDGVKTSMEKEMTQFSGLAHVIQYKQMVEGKTYRQMSAELGYSEQHLRNTACKERYKRSTQSTNAS